MRYFKKNIFKYLTLLGVLMVGGVPKVNAGDVVTDFVGNLFGSLVEGIAQQIASGLAALIGYAINSLGSLFFSIASFLVEYMVEMNLQFPQSTVIPIGLQVTIPLANIFLILALIIASFATIVRADWLVEIRKAIPKIIAATLLLNFTFLIFAQIVVPGVDKTTKQIFDGINYSEDSFRKVLKPNIDIESILQVHFAIQKTGEEDADPQEREALLTYLKYRDDFIGSTWTTLTKAQEALPDGAVTEAHKLEAIRTITKYTDEWLRDPFQNDIGGAWNSLLSFLKKAAVIGITGFLIVALPGVGLGAVTIVGGTLLTISAASDVINAAKLAISGVADGMHADWKESDLNQAIGYSLLVAPGYAEKMTKAEYQNLIFNVKGGMIAAADTHFKCDLTRGSPSGNGDCRSLALGALLVSEKLTGWERVIVKMVEAMFNGTWAFIGVITLFGLATMLFIRYIALSMLIIVFPIILILWPFPKLASIGGKDAKGLWSSWWSQFLRWLFFAPIMLFFVWMAVRLSSGLDKVITLEGANLKSGNVTGLVGASIGDLFVVVGFLVGGLYVANKMSITGAGLFYGGIVKARNKIGSMIKRGALAPGKYAWKKGKEQAGKAADSLTTATNARRLELSSRPLRTEAGRQQTEDLATSDSRIDRYRARRRMGRVQNALDAAKEQEKRRLFMHKDNKGEWKDNAPFMNSNILRGLMADPNTSATSLAAAYEMLGDGKLLPFETSTQQLLAEVQNRPGFVDEFGIQKAQNQMRKIGYSGRAELAAENHGDRHQILQGMLDDHMNDRATVRFDPDTYHPGMANSGGARTDAEQRAKIDAKNDFLNVYRSDQLAQNFGTLSGEQKADLVAASAATLGEFEGLMAAPGDTRSGFDTLTLPEQLEWIDNLEPARMTHLYNNANPNGTALERFIRTSDITTEPGRTQLRRSLRSIVSNNSNLTGQASMLGAFIGGGTTTTPPTP